MGGFRQQVDNKDGLERTRKPDKDDLERTPYYGFRQQVEPKDDLERTPYYGFRQKVEPKDDLDRTPYYGFRQQVQRFRVRCGLLGSEAGKGRPLDLGRMFANDAKTV